jgi:broad specificity phosphatase PhoE
MAQVPAKTPEYRRMTHLYFVRHGESEANVQRIFAGQMDTPLTEKGRAQAKAVGKAARRQHFDLIVSSPLIRAYDTAKIIAREIGYPIEKIVVNDVFKEHYIGGLSGKSWDEYDEYDARITDMETRNELKVRAAKGLELLKSLPGDTILLVGHGSFVRLLQEAIDPTHEYPEPPNAEVVQLI